MASENTISKPDVEPPARPEHTRCGRQFRPNVDIFEKEDEMVVLADVPGATGEQIDIEFEDGTLTIRAQVEPRQDADTRYLRQEYTVGDYYRSFQVNETIDADKMTAECNDGVLVLHLPKAQAAVPRKIPVKTG